MLKEIYKIIFVTMIGICLYSLIETTEYYVNEGWYETIENWDDYTEVYVNDYKVIAWQPLPEPYKEVEDEN